MSFEVIDGGVDTKTPDRRRLAPGAPLSPGTIPMHLAMALGRDEAVVWWDEKNTVSWRPVLWTLLGGLLLIMGATLFAPELWKQPWPDLWKSLAVPLLPALLVYQRERFARRGLVVTDESIVERLPNGRSDRLAFRNVRRVRRDFLTGGIRLDGQRHRVHIPPSLLEDGRQAIASQLRNRVQNHAKDFDDPLDWWPR